MTCTFSLEATDGAARAGTLTLPPGPVRTPAFMPVGTLGAVRGLHPEEVERFRAALRETAGGKLPTRIVDALRARRQVEMSDALRARLQLYATVPSVGDRWRRLTADYLDAVVDVVTAEDPSADAADTLMWAGAMFGASLSIPTLIARGDPRSIEELQEAAAALLERGIA